MTKEEIKIKSNLIRNEMMFVAYKFGLSDLIYQCRDEEANEIYFDELFLKNIEHSVDVHMEVSKYLLQMRETERYHNILKEHEEAKNLEIKQLKAQIEKLQKENELLKCCP